MILSVQDCIAALADPAMESQLPTITAFGASSSVSNLPLETVNHLISVVNDTPLDAKAPTPLVMAATCALSVIFQRGAAATAAAATVAALATNAGVAGTATVTASGVVTSNGAANNSSGDSEPTPEASPAAAASSNNTRLRSGTVTVHGPVTTVSELVRSRYAALFATLLMRAGTAHGVDERVSSKQAIRALKDFFKCVEQDKVLSGLHNAEIAEGVESAEDKDSSKGAVWSKLDSATYDDSVSVITKTVCSELPQLKRELLEFLAHFYSQQAYTGQRVVATAMLAEFVSHSAGDADLQGELIRFLLPRVADKVAKVRKQALRGLGNLVTVWTARVAEQATSVISVLSGATEDSDAEVAAEAVASLTRVAQVVDLATMGPNLVSICFRMRATFDRKQVKVRRAAFALFAELARFATPVTSEEYRRGVLGDAVNENFHDQVHTNLPIYLSHVNDEDDSVSAAALAGLKKVATLLDPSLQEALAEAEVDVDNYDQLCNEVTRLMARHYGDRLRGYVDAFTAYYGSNWTRIRANAAYCTAALVRHSGDSLAADAKKRLNLHSIAHGLIKMLDQESDAVRNKVSKALALLYDC